MQAGWAAVRFLMRMILHGSYADKLQHEAQLVGRQLPELLDESRGNFCRVFQLIIEIKEFCDAYIEGIGNFGKAGKRGVGRLAFDIANERQRNTRLPGEFLL